MGKKTTRENFGVKKTPKNAVEPPAQKIAHLTDWLAAHVDHIFIVA